MKKTTKNIYTLALLGGSIAILSGMCLFHKMEDFSVSERRKLASFPELSVETVKDGSFMSKFETYSQDQFPNRELFRKLKSMGAYYLLGQKDIHNIYIEDGYAAAIVDQMSEVSVSHALERFENLYESYLKDKDMNIYSCVIPDKGYFLAESNGYPSMDYEKFFHAVYDGMDYAEKIEIQDEMNISMFYHTDSHWKETKIVNIADLLLKEMGNEITREPMEEKTATDEFYGVYYGQAALPMNPDSIHYLTNETLASINVTNFETGKTLGIYDEEKLTEKDPYEFFLSGSAALLKLENKDCNTGKKLIVFRDSFGSSMVPLLAEAYEEIWMIDIRYVASDLLPRLVDFDSLSGADVLYLYGTALLNSSGSLK